MSSDVTVKVATLTSNGGRQGTTIKYYKWDKNYIIQERPDGLYWFKYSGERTKFDDNGYEFVGGKVKVSAGSVVLTPKTLRAVFRLEGGVKQFIQSLPEFKPANSK